MQPPNPWNLVAARVYERASHTYAVCLVNAVGGGLCWQGYRRCKAIEGPATIGWWEKVPCNTRVEEKRYPKFLARLGQEFLNEYKEGLPCR
jgi:hypothetical protein